MAPDATIQRCKCTLEAEQDAHPHTPEGPEGLNPLAGLFDPTVHYAPSPVLPPTAILAPRPHQKPALIHVVKTDEGEQIRMQRASVDADVWSDPEKMSVFLGKTVNGNRSGVVRRLRDSPNG